MLLTPQAVKDAARACGFELAGVCAAKPLAEARFYREWLHLGMAGEMSYLGGRRGEMRADPRALLPSARSVICVGKLYNGPQPYSTEVTAKDAGRISRYAWGDDYHEVLRRGLERLVDGLKSEHPKPFEWKICVDTAPLLERACARLAGLGWIGKNSCLINQRMGSWFVLGEVLISLDIEPDAPPPDRCGTCTRCIDACPTRAIVPTHRDGGPSHTVDSRRCISYFTIELRGAVPESCRAPSGNHIFGCDICQEVCPWNGWAAITAEPAFAPRLFAPSLERLASLSEEEFLETFRGTPVTRSKYSGFLRNVAVAMGNSGLTRFRTPLEKLAAYPDPVVAEHARWALRQLE